MRRAFILSCTVLTAGCFNYTAVPVTSIGVGSEVRITLTDAGTTTVTPAIGTYAQTLEGTVRSAEGQGVTVALASVTRRGAGTSQWNGELVSLAAADIRDMQQKQLSRRKSWTAGALFVAGGVAIITAIAKARGSATGDGRPTIPGT